MHPETPGPAGPRSLFLIPGAAMSVCVRVVLMCVFIWDYPRRSEASSRLDRRCSLQMIHKQFGRCLRVGQLSVTISPQPPASPRRQPPQLEPRGIGELDGSYWRCECVRLRLLTPAEGRKHPRVKRAKSLSDLFSCEDQNPGPHKHRSVKHTRRRK